MLGACTPTLANSTPILVTPTPALEVGPTPLPVRTRHAPGELFEYYAQSGDTLPALAAHFNTSVEEILASNPDLPLVLIHDIVRPFIRCELIEAVVQKAREQGGAIVAVAVPDTVKRVERENTIVETISRKGLYLARHPSASNERF